MISRKLVKKLRRKFKLKWTGIHGVPHWARVRVNGLWLAESTGAILQSWSCLLSCMIPVAGTTGVTRIMEREPQNSQGSCEGAISIYRTTISICYS